MRLFVYEHITGAGLLGQPLPASLAHEGDLMIRTLVRQLVALEGIEVILLRDSRLPALDAPVTQVVPTDPEDAARLFFRCVEMADAVWPIAPETGGTLARLSRLILSHDRPLLGSAPEAVDLAASKFQTAQALRAAGVPVVPAFRQPAQLPDGPLVAKPDDGAGCLDTFCFANRQALQRARAQLPAGLIYQPYQPGEAMSLSVLCCDGRAQLLSINRQRVSLQAGRFVFGGVDVNVRPDRDGALGRLAQAVVTAIPGLWGLIGIDFLMTPQGPVVVEINPRLTTACSALGEALGINPAALVLALPDFPAEDLMTGRPVAVVV